MNADLVPLILDHLSCAELLQLEETLFHRPAVQRQLCRVNPLELILALYPEVDWKRVSQSRWIIPTFMARYWGDLKDTLLSNNPVWSRPEHGPQLELLLEHPGFDWDWQIIATVINLTPELLQRYRDRWDMNCLSSNRSLTPAMIVELCEELDWSELVANPALPLELLLAELQQNGSRRICPNSLTFTPHLTSQLIRAWMEGGLLREYNWPSLCDNPALTEEIIEQYQEQVNWDSLSSNPCLTSSLIVKYAERLNWSRLSGNRSLTSQLILQYQDRINWRYLSYNPSLTPDIILRYHDRLDWKALSANRAVLAVIAHLWEDNRLQWTRLSWMVLEAQPELLLQHRDWPWNFSVQASVR